MRPPRMHVVAVPSEIGDFTEEVRQIFRELGRGYSAETLAGECAPPLDVFETDDAIEIVVDLPGTEPSGVRLLSKGDSVLIAGEKPARRARAESSFHLVERGYGRFARVVRLGRACDTSRAKATLIDGELRVTLPKVADRRGRLVPIAIAGAAVHG
ncbi:MAG TPA: Hsp20/alpha crystallin family protein [Vicinamibacterales bacterium]|nr:Hsp20/alpha crystallin family protein [Vicinamibacterales bacterium]